MSQTSWRNDIAGLRALAVLPVVIYHFFPNLIPNGFLGVDIFFVISGYLISGIIFRGLSKNQFSWKEFYAKRIRRIFPNLLLVLLSVAILGWLFLTTQEYVELAKLMKGTALFYENIRRLNITNYFDLDSSFKPLLHMWSLAVEEQFYIFFPLVCLALWKVHRYPLSLGLIVIAITVASLLCCLVMQDKAFSFYFPLTRFWELSIGIVLSWAEVFYLFKIKTARVKNVLSFVATFLIVFSLWVPISEQATPNWVNLITVLGALGLIAAGKDALVNRVFLSISVMGFIGAISYSWYLWHWPLFSFLTIIYPQHNFYWLIGVFFVSLGVATLAYFYVENPIRKLSGKTGKRAVQLLLLLMLSVVGFSFIVWHMKGIPDRGINHASVEVNKRISGYFWSSNFVGTTINGIPVQVTSLSDSPSILVVGDSHSKQFNKLISRLSRETGKTVAFYQYNGELIIPRVTSFKKQNNGIQDKLFKLLEFKGFKTVLISQYWGRYNNNPALKYISSNGVEYTGEKAFILSLLDLRDWIKKDSNRNYYVTLDAPAGSPSLNLLNYFNRYTREQFPNEYWVPIPKEDNWRKANEEVKEKLGSSVKYKELTSYVCQKGKCDLLRYIDDDHLNTDFLETQPGLLIDLFNESDYE